MISFTRGRGARGWRNEKKNTKAGTPHTSQRSGGGRSSTRWLDALEERAVLDEYAAALVGLPHAVDVVVVLGETLAVLLVCREGGEVDQGQRRVGRAGELGRQPVADEVAAAARNDAAKSPRVALKVLALPRVDRVANAKRHHGLSPPIPR